MAALRTCILLSLLLLLPLAAIAAQSGYITVVSTPADVVTAADFAAAMRAAPGVTFTGATPEQVDADRAAYDGKLLVIISGKDVTLVQGAGDATVVAAARKYFEGQGFSVTTGLFSEAFPAAPENTSVAPPENTSAPAPTPVQGPRCDGCRYGSQCLAEGTRAGSQYCDGVTLRDQKGEGEPCGYDYECLNASCTASTCGTPPPALQPAHPSGGNVFVRVWRWLKGLFWVG